MCQEGIGNKVYTKGQLVHLALTRVPVNPRTDMEVAKAMTIETKKQDAESIIGELSDTLEEKSMTADVLVTKSEEVAEVVEEKSEVPVAAPVVEEAQVVEQSIPEPVEKAKVASDKKDEELTYDEADEEKREQRRNRPAGERSLLQKSFDSIESKVMEMKSQGVPAETALREIQPMYNALGEQIKKSLQPEPTIEETKSEISELTNIVKSLAETVSTLQQTMSTEIATLKAQTQSNASVRQLANGIPMPRSLSGANLPEQKAELPPLPGVPSSLRSLAYKSTFVR
jgi:chromosome segregation ATPase